MFGYSKRSRDNLAGTHPDLQKVFNEVIKRTPTDFIITEGRRTMARQHQLVRDGKSWTYNSYHLYGLAVDIVPLKKGKISWAIVDFIPIIKVITEVADEMGIDVRSGYLMWGKDGPHFQLHTIDGKPAREVYDVRKV